MDPPAFQAFNSPCNVVEVLTRAPILTLRNLGKLDPELFLQPGLQAQVRDEILITNLESEPIARSLPDQFDRQQQERGEPLDLGSGVLTPLQESQRKEQDVDPLLLLKRTAFMVEAQKALLQPIQCHLCLKSGVRVAI